MAFCSVLSAGGQRELADLSLEELSSIEITSLSKQPERLLDAATSVYIITGEDIRRSAANSLPDALRLAPNLQVARVTAQSYAISARGFNSTTANKLLVLIDGRAVYTPLFSGVFWDAQEVPLEDVERIEVISGPGGTIWGTNAVNGVINVITKSAADTQGGLAAAGAGSAESAGVVRYGGRLSGGAAYRIYGKYFDGDNTVRANGTAVPDSRELGQVGFRTDWGTAASRFTVQGDAYGGRLDAATPSDTRISGANLLGRWNTRLATGGQINLQGYFDSVEREVPGTFTERLHAYELELLHVLAASGRHSISWGGNHRSAQDRVTNSPALAFLPGDTTLRWTSFFVQDDIRLSEKVRLAAGGKVERNSYTGTEFLPSARLAWKPDPGRLVWAALSRAVRTPSRIDRDFFVPGQPPFILAGGPGFRSEVARVAELGYRAQPSAQASYSVTVFHAAYDRLRSLESIGAGRFVLGNKMEGSTSGIETWGTYQASRAWRLSAGLTVLRERLRMAPDSTDPTGPSGAGNDPAHQWQLRSSHDLGQRQEFDLVVRRVGALPSPAVPSYTAVDLRYGIRLLRTLEASLSVQNLLDQRHPEFGAAATRSEVARAVFGKVKWLF